MTRIIRALGVSIVAATAGTALAAGPTGKVKPNMHLANGQTVKVTGRGFSPNEAIYIVECNKTAKKSGEAACNLYNLVATASNAKGRVPVTKFTVETGVTGNGNCGTSKATEKCYIALSNASMSEVALVAIAFNVK
jgi:hypothetical protein